MCIFCAFFNDKISGVIMGKLRTFLIIVFIAVTVAFCGGQIYLSLLADTTPPEIKFDSDTVTIRVKDDNSKLLSGVIASDNRDGDLSDEVIVSGVSNLISNNTAKVTYIVFDSANNMATASRTVVYSDYERPKFRIEEPLEYTLGESISLTDRLFADDAVDGDISDSIRISALDINSSTEGTYYISVQVVNSMGDTASVTLPIVLRSAASSAPQIELSSYLLYLDAGSSFNASDYVSYVSGGSTSDVSISGTVDTLKAGTYHVSYSCSNSGGTGTSVLTVVVE